MIVWRCGWLLIVSGLGACAGDGAPSDTLGDCVDDGEFEFTHALQPGSDALCPEIDPETLRVSEGRLANDCDPSCDCDTSEAGPPVCQGTILQTCTDGTQTTTVDCTFALGQPQSVSGSCEVVLETGVVDLSCGYDISGTRL